MSCHFRRSPLLCPRLTRCSLLLRGSWGEVTLSLPGLCFPKCPLGFVLAPWRAVRVTRGGGHVKVPSRSSYTQSSRILTVSHKYQSLHGCSPRCHWLCSHFLFGWMELLTVNNQVMKLKIQIRDFCPEIGGLATPGPRSQAAWSPGCLLGGPRLPSGTRALELPCLLSGIGLQLGKPRWILILDPVVRGKGTGDRDWDRVRVSHVILPSVCTPSSGTGYLLPLWNLRCWDFEAQCRV